MRWPFHRSRTDRDWEEELRIHRELYTEDQLGSGVPRPEAARRAALKLGNSRSILERIRDGELSTFFGSLFRDAVIGLRALRKSPMFTFTAVLTLALGIGANTAVFTLLYGLILRGLPVPQPASLARINTLFPSHGSTDEIGVPWTMFQDIRRRQHSFAALSACTFKEAVIPEDDGTPRMYSATLVTGDTFGMLGLKPYLGRLLMPSDDIRGGPAHGWPVVLSYGFWNDRFHADPAVIGKSIHISGAFATVAGVTPPDFQGLAPGWNSRVYLPMQFEPVLDGFDDLHSPGHLFWIYPLGRLSRDSNFEIANAEIAVYQSGIIHRNMPSRYLGQPFVNKLRFRVSSARTGLPVFGEEYKKPLFLMQALVGIVLLLCCVNLSGLMLSKAYSRRREFAVRTALGAARWRLIRQYLTESFLIACAGAALGAGAAWSGSRSLLRFFVDPNMAEGTYVAPDSTVFLATAILAVVATVVFGMLPAWRAGRSDPGTLLNSRAAVGGRRQIVGKAFIPIQVALSLVLVSVAGVLSQSLIHLRSQNPGFDAAHVTIETPPFQQLPQKGLALLDLYQKMVDRLEQMPGIESAAVTYLTPMTNDKATGDFEAAGGSAHPPEDSRMAYNEVGPGYFRTMQTHILTGREFERQERESNVCVINQSAAEFLFPRMQPLGQYVRSNDPLRFPQPVVCRVIGIAEDAKYANMREPAPRTIYLPAGERTVNHRGNLVFLMRGPEEKDIIAGYRQVASEFVPTIPVVRFATLEHQMGDSMGAQRLITLLSNFFAALALLLSAIGLYGLLSSSVAQRTGEIGVRIALGARPGTVLQMVLKEALWLLAGGIVLGLIAMTAALRPIRQMLYGVAAWDPVTLAATLVVLTLVTLLAALIPARRAASVDPIVALRIE